MNDLDQLVHAARSLDTPVPCGAEQRMWAAVMASPASAAPLIPAAITTAKSTSLSLVVKVSLGLVLLGGGVGLVAIGSLGSTAAIAPTETQSTEPESSEPESAAAAPSSPSIPTLAAPPAASPARPEIAKTRSARRARATSTATRETQEDLAEETKLLRAAKVALGRGEAKTAHALLVEHHDRFPNGELVELRMALDVSTACALAQPKRAAAARDRFLARFPRSALAGRVRQGCTEGGP